MTFPFIPLTRLLSVNDLSFAKFKANTSIVTSSDFVFSKQSVINVASMLNAASCERIFIACHDRSFFVCALLASFAVQKPIYLPHMLTKSSISEIMCDMGDLLITDQEHLIDASKDTILASKITPNGTYILPEICSQNQTITFYTSGSNGIPKPIQKNLFQLETELECLHALWGGNLGTFHATVSHQHIYGLLFSILWPLCAGFTIARYTYALWEHLFSELSERDVIVSSPSHLGRFPINTAPMTYPCFVFSSGAPLTFSCSNITRDYLNVHPIEVYGSTETGGIAYRIQKDENTKNWQPFPSVNVSVNKDDRLCLKSLYLPNSDWFTANDCISLNEDGTFILNGRSDRVVKIEGKRICLLDIEHRIKSHDYILDVIALLLTSDSRSELGIIAVLNNKGNQALETSGKAVVVKELRSHLSSFFEPIFIPKKWRFVSKIPQNEQGKSPYELLLTYFKKDSSQ